jgi:hypothetical protein
LAFSIVFSALAASQMHELARDRSLAKRLKAVRKVIGRLELNPRHPGLQSHKFQSMSGPRGEGVFEVYAEQATPAAYRVFWCYGPAKSQITIVAITSHP